MKILIAGTFDHFHIGHQYLCWTAFGKISKSIDPSSEAQKQLIIIVARDKTVQKIKGRRAVNHEADRLKRVQSEFENYESVNILLGRADGDFFQLLRDECPDEIFLGYDQQFNTQKALEVFPHIKITRAKPYAPEFFKSSKFNRFSDETVNQYRQKT